MRKNSIIDEIGENEPKAYNFLNKKHLFGCLIIILLVGLSTAAVVGIFYWQKGGKFGFINEKNINETVENTAVKKKNWT